MTSSLSQGLGHDRCANGSLPVLTVSTPHPKRGDIRTIGGDVCRFVGADDKGDVWGVLSHDPRTLTDSDVGFPERP